MFRPTILRFASLPSTNTEAARQAALGAPEGLCIVAGEQTAGRGRQERAWASPAGAGLYCSLVLRPQLEMSMWPLLSLMAAVAVADALHEICELATDIKWPNDVLAEGRKVCGILAETVETGRGRAGIIGIGINIRAGAFPPEISETAISIEESQGRAPDTDKMLESLLRALAGRYAMLQAPEGAQATLAAWTARSSYATGKRVRVALGTQVIEGVTRGLEPDGALRVETGAGEIRTVRAGDVTALRPAEGA